MDSIDGKTALVIGGSGGIGSSVCEALAACGVHLIIHGGSESKRFDVLAEKLGQKVRVETRIQRFESGFLADFASMPLYKDAQKADIICVCFGPFVQKALEDTDSADWERAALNYLLPGVIVSAALRPMIKRSWGRFLFFGGTRTDRINAFRTNAAYAGAKTALSSLVRSVALTYAAQGITCNAVLPGFTCTEYVSENERKKRAAQMPQKRLLEPNEIADAAVFLLRNPMLNGVLLPVDGGWAPDFGQNTGNYI